MHILHLTPYYAPAYPFGGVVRSVEGMATSLVARGHQVTVLTTDALDQRGRFAGSHDETLDGIRVIRCPNVSPWLRGKLYLSTPRRMKRIAETLLPAVDVVHLHEFRTLENLLVTPVAQSLGVPIVLSPHGTLDRSTGRGVFKSVWDRLLGSGVAARIDHVLGLTGTELADIQSLWASFGSGTARTSFSIVPNGVHLHEFKSPPDTPDFRDRYGLGDAPTVLYLGRLQARKGLDILVSAFRAANVKESRLLIVGPDEGMLASLRSLADGDSRIVFTGYLDGEDRIGALAASDIFALPATGEGQPLAALEAMAASLPLVLSPGCNMDEVAAAGAGYVVDPTVEAFAKTLRTLLTDEEMRRKLGNKARQLVEERYSWDKIAERLEAVYTQLL